MLRSAFHSAQPSLGYPGPPSGRRIPTPLRGQVPTAKQRFREIGKQQLTRDLVVELEQLVVRGLDCLRAERRRQYRVFMERERGY